MTKTSNCPLLSTLHLLLMLFDPNPLNQPIRPPRRKRGIHHTLPERRQVHTEEVKTYPDDIVADEQNTMTSMQGLHDQTLERILIRPHIAAHYQHLISNSYYCQTWFLLLMVFYKYFVSKIVLTNWVKKLLKSLKNCQKNPFHISNSAFLDLCSVLENKLRSLNRTIFVIARV